MRHPYQKKRTRHGEAHERTTERPLFGAESLQLRYGSRFERALSPPSHVRIAPPAGTNRDEACAVRFRNPTMS